MKEDHCFSKAKRLLNKKDYKRVFDDAKKIHNRAFTLLIRKNDLSYARLGLILAKKNVKLAHKRNAIKRHLRESFRIESSTFKNYDLIFLTRKEISKCSDLEIIDCRNKIFKRFMNKYCDTVV
jgi:ribonuclease P protein component